MTDVFFSFYVRAHYFPYASGAKKRGNVLVKVRNHEPFLSPWLELCVVIIVQWTKSSKEKHFPDTKDCPACHLLYVVH